MTDAPAGDTRVAVALHQLFAWSPGQPHTTTCAPDSDDEAGRFYFPVRAPTGDVRISMDMPTLIGPWLLCAYLVVPEATGFATLAQSSQPVDVRGPHGSLKISRAHWHAAHRKLTFRLSGTFEIADTEATVPRFLFPHRYKCTPVPPYYLTGSKYDLGDLTPQIENHAGPFHLTVTRSWSRRSHLRPGLYRVCAWIYPELETGPVTRDPRTIKNIYIPAIAQKTIRLS